MRPVSVAQHRGAAAAARRPARATTGFASLIYWGRAGCRDRLDSGQRIGRYQPIRRLAVGGMAEIYLARVPGVGIEGFEKLVVLKRILPQHALDPELLRMFLDEARLSATLTHPHVTRSTTSAPTATRPSSRWSTCTARTCARSCARRDAPRAHRTRRARRCRSRTRSRSSPPRPRGCTTRTSGSAPAASRSASCIATCRRRTCSSPTTARSRCPTSASRSGRSSARAPRKGRSRESSRTCRPSSAAARPVDRRSDVFALGAILYEMTTGAAPFSGASDLDILNQIATGSRRAAGLARGEGRYPPALSEIVMRALAPEPGGPLPDDAGAADRARVVRARRRARAVDGRAGVVRAGAVRRRARRLARRPARREVAGRAPGGASPRRRAGRIPRTAPRPTPSGRPGCARAAVRALRATARSPASSPVRRRGRARRPSTGARRRARRRLAPPPRAATKIRGRRRRARKGIRQPYRPRKELAVDDGDSGRRDDPLPASTTRARPRPRRRRRDPTAKTTARVTAGDDAPGAQPPPRAPRSGYRATAESRLGAWDPDSPVPP